MHTHVASSRSRVGLVAVIGLTAITLLGVQPAAAQHRARLGAGLERQLAGGSSSLSVIIEAPQSEVDRLAKAYGLRVVKRLEMGAVLSGSSEQIGGVAGDTNVGALNPDDQVISTMAVTTQSTGASLLWRDGSGRNFGGLTGDGVGVAVLDSGIAPHPDLVRRIGFSADFTGEEGVVDGYGHGTHIGGIIAGSGAGSRSEAGSAYVGMAPGATLISLRVLASDGTGYVSDVIQAIEWAVKNKHRYKIRVINLSLGHAADGSYRDDPLAQAVERAVAAGLVVVSSAGNLGKTADGTPVIGAVVSPGYTPGALTVGALNTRGTVVRSDDGVATYSSRGPVGDPDDPSTWEIKPDLVAPGNAIVSAGQPGTLLWENFPERRVGGSNGGTYLTLSGSSMATAVVSGAVAQLLQLQPKLTPAEVKFALQFTAERLDGFGLIEQGAGSLNVALAAGLVSSGNIQAAPTSNVIGGETAEGGQIAFSNTVIWGGRNGVGGDTVIWGGRGGVGGNTVIWGGRNGVGGDTVIWGGRNGVGGDTVIWGGRNSVFGDTVIWGGRNGMLFSDTVIWGGRNGSAVLWGDTVIWGGRSGVDGNTVIWGGRNAATLWGDTVIWGGRNGVGGDTVIWGGRNGVGGDTVIWGGRNGVGGDTVIWGGRNGVGGDTVIWGGRNGVGGDTVIWGGRNGVGGDTVIWGGRNGVGGDTVIWGGRNGVGGDTVIWGGRNGVGGDTVIWGGRNGVGGDTVIWGGRNGGVLGDTVIWGGRAGGVVGDTVIWGGRSGTVTSDTVIWGGRNGTVSADTVIWGGRQ